MLKSHSVRSPVKIKVVGIGGGGCNSITHMARKHFSGVEFVAMNTDIQHLTIVEAPVRLALGERLTHGSGAGGDPDLGRKCAEANLEEIKQALAGSDMVFLAAGMGGGTGTGAIPLVAAAARQGGTLVVAIVTQPFQFEGRRRMEIAAEGISRLMKNVDTLIIVPNDRLLELTNWNTNIDNAFKMADEILSHAVQTVTDLILVPGLINIDFASVRNVMRNSGPAWMSMGQGSGPYPALEAAREALQSPLLDVSINAATKALFRITSGGKLTLSQVNEAALAIRKAIHPDAEIVFGVNIDLNMTDEVRLTLIATGLAASDRATVASIESKRRPFLRSL